jgi:hypothetical protein
MEVEQVLSGTDSSGHRETDGIVVDLFWNRADLDEGFRVEVQDRPEGDRFVLCPTTG